MAQRGADAVAADLDRLVRRLRGFSPRAWETGDRRDAVLALLTALAALGAPGRRLPALPDYVLGDAVAVLGHDAMEDPGHRGEVGRLVGEALRRTR